MADGEHGAASKFEGTQATFTAMVDGTKQDWMAIGQHMASWRAGC
jgi:hypothetical protein